MGDRQQKSECQYRGQRETGNVFTYLAMLDAPHSAHGGKAADEGAALHLHIVRLHLDSVQHNSVRLLQRVSY